MSGIIVGMRMSLDGFVNEHNGSISRLYPDMEAVHQSENLKQAIEPTGAVVMGRHSYDMAEGNFTGYEFQTPFFVVTHHPPETVARGENEHLKFFFITDGVQSAIAQANRQEATRTLR